MKKVTLQEIADKVGVSVATVSRVLSKKKLRNTKTELSVISAAKDLGYPYLPMKFKDEKLKNIVFITQLEEGEFYMSLFKGFHEASIGTNCCFTLVSLKDKKQPISEIINTINSYDAGCIFLPNLNEEDYLLIKGGCYNIPIVSLAPIPTPIIDTITFDSYSGGNIMAKYYYESGFNDVGIIYGKTNLAEANNRKNGFLDYINSHNSMRLIWQYDGDYSTNSGKAAFHDFKERGFNEKIAIFSCNDTMALGFLREATASGIDILKNIKLAGYDDIPMCKNTIPPLTSIKTNYRNIADQVILYFEQKTNDLKGHLYLVPVSLARRKSTV
jgi:LacI family transcriptional regulator|tara:strand:- start:554 stop:1537 length:984 start_codon:yes stop_codon:yes gene_type:complete